MIPSFPVNSLGTTNPEILDRILKILSIHSPPSLPPSLPPSPGREGSSDSFYRWLDDVTAAAAPLIHLNGTNSLITFINKR